MAQEQSPQQFTNPLRRLFIGLTAILLLALLLLWRIDNPRVERIRAQVIDDVVPPFDWAMRPLTTVVNMATDLRSYQKLIEQNHELRQELQRMRAWHEAAVRLDEQNAKLLDLNNLKTDPKLTYISGVVMTDSGSPFRQSVLLNVGARDGIRDGWPVMDGIGLVGRISGIGNDTSRAVLLTDSNSRVPATIHPSGQRAILAGDNTLLPLLLFVENPDTVRPGDRIVSSGDGGVFPPDLLIGQVVLGTDRRLRVRLAADYERLSYLRVLRATAVETISDPGKLVWPELSIQGPPPLRPPMRDSQSEAG